MAITNKNCFFKGFLTGQSIREGYTRLPGDGTPYEPNTALSGTADYDKESFLCGLAAGLAARGRLRRSSGAAEISIDTRDSTTDELLCELYLLDSKGLLSVPKLPGMTALQQWMGENGFTDPSQYEAKFAAVGDEIAWSFFRMEYARRDYWDSVLPIVYPVGPRRLLSTVTQTGYLTYYPYGTWTSYNARRVASAAMLTNLGLEENKLTGRLASTNGYTQHLVWPVFATYRIKMLAGRYRLTMLSAGCTPEPGGEYNRCPSGIFYSWGYQNPEMWSVVAKSDGCQYNSSNLALWRRIPPGNWMEVSVTEDKILQFSVYAIDCSPISLSSAWGYDLTMEAGVAYTAEATWKIELLELYGTTTDENATLTEVLRAGDRTKNYFLSRDGGKTLKPLLIIDQTNNRIRDLERVRRYADGTIEPDINYPTRRTTQTETHMPNASITVNGFPEGSSYLNPFDDYDSSMQIIEKEAPVTKMEYTFKEEGNVPISMDGAGLNRYGTPYQDSATYRIRRRVESEGG